MLSLRSGEKAQALFARPTMIQPHLERDYSPD